MFKVRNSIPFFAVAVVLGVMVSSAVATSPHLVRATGDLSGKTVEIDAKYAGLGSELEYTGTLSGSGQVICTNRGGNIAPGQSFSFGPLSDTKTTSRAGTLTFVYTFDLPKNAGCPNGNWKVSAFVNATLGAQDVATSGATVSLANTCSGAIPGTLSCSN